MKREPSRLKFDDLIATIDALDVDEVVDWQMTKSPAAHVEREESFSPIPPLPAPPRATFRTELPRNRPTVFPMMESLFIPRTSLDDWRPVGLRTVIVEFVVERQSPFRCLYRIQWGSGGGVQVFIEDEMARHVGNCELGRWNIESGVFVTLKIDGGQVKAFVERER